MIRQVFKLEAASLVSFLRQKGGAAAHANARFFLNPPDAPVTLCGSHWRRNQAGSQVLVQWRESCSHPLVYAWRPDILFCLWLLHIVECTCSKAVGFFEFKFKF